MRIRAFFVASIGLVIGLLVLAIWRTPRVAGWEPKDNMIRARQPITLRFSSPVSADSARRRFEIRPPVDGDLIATETDLVFKPAVSFEYGQAYTVTLDSGVRGLNNLPSLRRFQRSFSIAEPELLYLREAEGRTNLWKSGGDGKPVQITDEEMGIWDYSVLPDGSGVIVSGINEDGSDDLVSISLDGRRTELLTCDDSECRSGRWQPGGSLVAYERRGLDETADQTELWLVDTSTGATLPVYEITNMENSGLDTSKGRYPRWSTDGRYLAYFNPDQGAIIVVDWFQNRPWLIPAVLDVMGKWAPADHRLAYTELVSAGEVDGAGSGVVEEEAYGFYAHVMVADFARSTSTDLSDGLDVNDGIPEWRPDGHAIAAGRSDGGKKQIWMIPLEGQIQEALTDDPYSSHTSLSWSPDGRFLAFMRSGDDLDAHASGIWTIDLDSGKAELRAGEGFVPGWLP